MGWLDWLEIATGVLGGVYFTLCIVGVFFVGEKGGCHGIRKKHLGSDYREIKR